MDIRDDLKAYLDGELSPERAEEVRLALLADPELEQEMHMFQKITSSFRAAAPAVSGSAEGKEQVLRGLPPSKPPRKKLFGLPTPVLAIAACALLGIIFAPSLMKGPGGSSDAAASVATMPESADKMKAEAKAPAPGVAGAAAPSYANSADAAKAAAPAKKSVDRGGFAAQDEGLIEEQPVRPGTTVPPLGRQAAVIKNTQMEVKVPDAGQAMNDARKFATEVGGFVESSQMTHPKQGETSGSCQLRVPARANDATLEKLRGLGVVQSETSTGQDVTSQIVDQESRLKNLRNEEESVRIILAHTKKLSEVLAVRDRLNEIRQEIEQIDGQRKNLTDLSSYSIINCSFTEKERIKPDKPETGWAGETWAGAVNGLKSAGQFLGSILITLFVYSPIWLPIALIGTWLYKRSKNS